MSEPEEIPLNMAEEMIRSKVGNGYTGEIRLVFLEGRIITVKKVQLLNRQRLAREVKRDQNVRR